MKTFSETHNLAKWVLLVSAQEKFYYEIFDISPFIFWIAFSLLQNES